MMNIRTATFDERKKLCDISKTHRAGNGFTNALMFSGEVHFGKGWLRVIEDDGEVIGFTCVRVKSREPVIKLYYIIVSPKGQGRRGVGQALLNDLMANAPATHRTIACDCLKDNEQALAFYRKNGFNQAGESLGGKGFKLVKTW